MAEAAAIEETEVLETEVLGGSAISDAEGIYWELRHPARLERRHVSRARAAD